MTDLKVCTGCGHFSDDPIGESFLACCPDNKYIPVKEYTKMQDENVIRLKKEKLALLKEIEFLENKPKRTLKNPIDTPEYLDRLRTICKTAKDWREVSRYMKETRNSVVYFARKHHIATPNMVIGGKRERLKPREEECQKNYLTHQTE